MNSIIYTILVVLFPINLFAQVPTISAPVPKQGLAFYMKAPGVFRSPVNDPLIVKAQVDTLGKCNLLDVVNWGDWAVDTALNAKLEQLDFFPGRWGDEAVERVVYLIFSQNPSEKEQLTWEPPGMSGYYPVFHFYKSMLGWEKEKEEYLYYQHIHRYLYPPVGYEESDENGDFTETITHYRYPYEDEFPDPNAYFEGELPQPIDIETFRTQMRIPQVLYEAIFEGQVILRILVDKEGNPSRYKVLKDGGHPLFLEAVTAHIEFLKFIPAKLDGNPSYCWVTIPFRFSSH